MLDQIRTDSAEVAQGIRHPTSFGSDVIVAGATGLIGQYVIETLREVNRLSGANMKIWALSSRVDESMKEAPDVLPVVIDLRSPSLQIDRLPSSAACLVFAAGYGQPGKFMESPLDPLAVNVTGLKALIDRLDEGGRVLYISSSEIYSGLATPPFDERQIGTTDPSHPRAPYIEAKRAGEAMVLAASRTGRIQASIARLALAYGPGTRSDDSRVLNEFIRAAVTEGRIRMRDSGSSMRTYCYVKDAVDMMLWLVSEAKDGVFNVGGESRTSIRDLASRIADLCDAELEVPLDGASGPLGAPDDVWLSLQKIRAVGYKSSFTSLDVGLQQTISWQAARLYEREGWR